MRRAREGARQVQRRSMSLPRPERLLGPAVRCHAANRIMIRHGRDDDIALTNLAISSEAGGLSGHLLSGLHPMTLPETAARNMSTNAHLTVS